MTLNSLNKTLAAAMLAVMLSTTSAWSYVADGMEYEISCNADGYVLTSKYPVTRITGTGVDAQAVPGIGPFISARAATPTTSSSARENGAGPTAAS